MILGKHTGRIAMVVAASLVSVGAANAQTTVVLGASVGGLNFAPATDTAGSTSIGRIDGSFAFGLGSAVRAQIDFDAETTTATNLLTARSYSQIGGHLGYNAFPISVFFALQSGQTAATLGGTVYTINRTMAGLEYGGSSGDFDYFVQAAASRFDSSGLGHSPITDASLVRIGSNYYTSPNSVFSFDVMAQQAPTNLTGQGPMTQNQASISYERQLASNTDWSWRASANVMSWQDFSHGGTPASTEAQLQFGFRFSPGGLSLQERNSTYAWWGLPQDMRGSGYTRLSH